MLPEHLEYAADAQRNAQFKRAIAQVLKPSDHVLDLGCGVGVLGALCLEVGAAKVTGIERGSVAEVAREVYARAGGEGRAEVMRGVSHRLSLPEPVDLIVCDHVGYFGLDYGILSLLRDARERLLKPGGRILPAGLDLFLAPVGSEECARLAFGWAEARIQPPLRFIESYAVNSKHPVTLAPENVLGTPAMLGSIDFLTEKRDYLSFKATMPITRAGTMHGLGGWFDCRLCDGIRMTNGPLSSERIDRPQALFPIAEPLEVLPGETIEASISMRPDEDTFSWRVTHRPSGRQFRQATLMGDVFGKADLKGVSPDHAPVPTKEARLEALLVGYCDGERRAGEIVEAVLRDHPDIFPSRQAMTEYVLGWLGRATQ